MEEVESYLTTWRIHWKAWGQISSLQFCASFLRDYKRNPLPFDSRLSYEGENNFGLGYYRNPKFIPRVNVMKNYEDPSREKGKVL